MKPHPDGRGHERLQRAPLRPPFVEPVARWGRRVSLAQTLLKLTAPGVPDVYQGNELWDLSLVDPDNRRPVDFASRRDMLGRLSGVSAEQAMAAEESGLPKLLVTVRALHLRRARPELFSADSPYTPLAVAGHRPDRAVAFARGMPPGAVTVVPRLGDPASQRWQDLRVAIPPGRWRDALSGDELNGGDVALSLVLRRLPVALLESVA